jgi:Lrp/AsnC family leucine-responsive transcriptional regulator
MDDTDRKIIAHIQSDGRASLAEVGAAAGLSVSAANERLRKLQAAGVVRGWEARIDPDALGLGLLAFVFLLHGDQASESAFREGAAALPEVLECHHVTGEWSYLLKVRTHGTAGLERLMARLKALPGVGRTMTTIALSSPKETARLPVVRP